MTLNSMYIVYLFFFFSSRRRHTRFDCDWSSDVCSSDLSSLAHEWHGGSGIRTWKGQPLLAAVTARGLVNEPVLDSLRRGQRGRCFAFAIRFQAGGHSESAPLRARWAGSD